MEESLPDDAFLPADLQAVVGTLDASLVSTHPPNGTDDPTPAPAPHRFLDIEQDSLSEGQESTTDVHVATHQDATQSAEGSATDPDVPPAVDMFTTPTKKATPQHQHGAHGYTGAASGTLRLDTAWGGPVGAMAHPGDDADSVDGAGSATNASILDALGLGSPGGADSPLFGDSLTAPRPSASGAGSGSGSGSGSGRTAAAPHASARSSPPAIAVQGGVPEPAMAPHREVQTPQGRRLDTGLVGGGGGGGGGVGDGGGDTWQHDGSGGEVVLGGDISGISVSSSPKSHGGRGGGGGGVGGGVGVDVEPGAARRSTDGTDAEAVLLQSWLVEEDDVGAAPQEVDPALSQAKGLLQSLRRE